jgi:hypothetical protein
LQNLIGKQDSASGKSSRSVRNFCMLE